MVWSGTQFVVEALREEVPAVVHRVVALVHLSLPPAFVLGVGDIDYWAGTEGRAARIYTFRGRERDADDAWWGVQPVYITVYAEAQDSETASIDVTGDKGLLLTVAGVGLDSVFAADVLDAIERVLEKA